MICPACGNENPAGSAFCEACGRSLRPSCPACGSEVGTTARFCRSCGKALDPTASPPVGLTGQPADPASFCDGRYEVRRLLGEGGKKRVFLAHDTKLDRDVAFALIKTDGLDEEGLLRIRREAQAMGRLGDHPHIVSVYDIGEVPGAGDWGLGVGGTSPTPIPQPYMVTQLMAGGDLETLIARAENHRIPLPQALDIADQVCQALEYAHGKGIIHRDLKPGNVWLTSHPDPQAPAPSPQPPPVAKLGDFGLAVALDRSRLTQAGMMVGTVAYMPPEQAMGAEVSARSDLYSLGAMVYEMVTGRPPFVGDESVAIITQHLNTPPVAPSWHAPDVPAGLEALILRLLEKDPAKRPASAAEVRQGLAAVRAPTPAPLPKLGEGPGVRAENPLYRRVFVGREAEIHQLRGAFDVALSGQGSLVMVVGEPGIGKTSICEQLSTYAALRGGRTLVGHCYEPAAGGSLPYLPFVEALRSYVLARDPEGLKQDLGSGAAEVARIVSEIRDRLPASPIPSPQSPAPASNPDEDRWRLLQAVAGFLRNASQVQPLLLILEDLHDADRGTLDLLLHLSRQLEGARLLVVGTYRDVEVDRTHPLSGALAELRRGSAFARIPLRGLTVDEVHRMMGLIRGQEVPWSRAEAIHRQTEGNPLFVQEVLRYVVEEGLLVRQGDRYVRTDDGSPDAAIPEGLRDVIGKRLSRLGERANQVLSIGAVIGREFRLDVLQRVAGFTEEELYSALEEASERAVVEERAGPGGALAFRFTHAFFRQTLYEEIFAARRIRWHQQVARALEVVHARRLEDHAAELAEHYAHSSDPDDLRKAVEFGELAARRAMAVYAYGEAVHHLEQALNAQDVLDPDDRARRCDLLLALGEAMGPAGDPQRAADEVAAEAFALAEALDDRTRACRACELALEALVRYGGGAMQSSPALRQWVARLDQHAPPASRSRVIADAELAMGAHVTGRFSEGWELADRALASARALADPGLLLHPATAVLTSLSPPRRWQDHLRLAREVVGYPRAGASTWLLLHLLGHGAEELLAAGERSLAEELWGELEQLAAHRRDPYLRLGAAWAAADRATLNGDLEQAVAPGLDMMARPEDFGSPVAVINTTRHFLVGPLLRLGRADEALRALMEGRRRMELPEFSFFVTGVRALCLAHVGRSDEARSELRQDLARLGISETEDDTPIRHLATLLETALLVGERDVAALLAPKLADIPATTLPIRGVARLLGTTAALLGDREAARGHYARALDWATKVRHRPEIALTRLGMAELTLDETGGGRPHPHPLPEGEGTGEALAHLDFAIEEFRAMKMQPSLERALRHKGLLTA